MDQILDLIRTIHYDCHVLCKQKLGRYLPVAGNIGIFSQSENEYALFTKIAKSMTFPSDNPNQKYFLLLKPIVVPEIETIPSATYSYLYIRKPDVSDYGKYRGDIDFILNPDEYLELKKSLLSGLGIEGLNIYDRPNWDNIQITDPNINSVAFVSTLQMAEKVRVKFD